MRRLLTDVSLAILAALLAVVPISGQALAQGEGTGFFSGSNPFSSSDFGGIGLLQTRTARFADDGQFDVGVSQIFPYRRYLLNAQALPWLEATFRYTEIENRGFFSTGPIQDGENSFKDRGADLKLRLLNEGRLLPAVAIGVQDGLGTGQFSGEYLVASKRWGDFDFSLGLGWGYTGARGGLRNPLASISDSFATRSSGSGLGGTLVVGNWFSGEEVAVFGGVEYFTPLRNLSLKLELDGNDYKIDPLSNTLAQSSLFNVGVNYRPFSWFEISAAYERGREFMFRGTFRANFNAAGVPKLDGPPPTLKIRPVIEDPPTGPTGVISNRAVGSLYRDKTLDSRLVSGQHIAIQRHLQREGISAAPLGSDRGAPVLRLSNIQSLPDFDVLERAAASAKSDGAREVVFLAPDLTSGPQTVRVPLDVVTEADIVDFFVGELEELRVSLLGLSFDEGQAEVLVLEDIDEGAAAEVARLSMLALPVAVGGVVVASKGGDRYRFSRPDVRGPKRAADAKSADKMELAETPVVATPNRFEIAEDIFSALRSNGLLGESVEISGSRITVRIVNLRYTEEARAYGRAAIVVANFAPPTVEEIEIVSMSGGLVLSRIVVLRKYVEATFAGGGSSEEILATTTVDGGGDNVRSANAVVNHGLYPNVNFSLSPAFKQHLGGGDVFLAYALALRGGATIELAPGISISGNLAHNVSDTFDRLSVTSSSKLPKVRSDIREYLQGSDTALTRLQANYLARIGPDLFGRATFGFLEYMYGGYSGEILYRPFGSRLAAGIDLNWVRQRDFDGKFGFRNYSVLTGFANLYYDLPFYDLLFQAHIGQYLAGDRGATFQISRRFESGVRAGVFVTFTDVPFDVFGEGSFDKGFFISVPLELFLVTRSRQGGTFGFRPLTKDGGQQLDVGPRLYDIVSQGNLNNVLDDWSKFLQ